MQIKEKEFLKGDTIEYYYFSYEKNTKSFSDHYKKRGYVLTNSGITAIASGGFIISNKKPISTVRLVLTEKVMNVWGKTIKIEG